MTTYSAVTSGESDANSPWTDTLVAKLANNHIAVAECDASAPSNLFPTVLLGTLTTTSGTTQTLSGLTLTPYRALRIVLKAVGHASNAANSIQLGTVDASVTTVNLSDTISGVIMVDLANSVVTGTTGTNIGNGAVKSGTGSYTTATTSISFSWTAGSSVFNAGSILVYGVK